MKRLYAGMVTLAVLGWAVAAGTGIALATGSFPQGPTGPVGADGQPGPQGPAGVVGPVGLAFATEVTNPIDKAACYFVGGKKSYKAPASALVNSCEGFGEIDAGSWLITNAGAQVNDYCNSLVKDRTTGEYIEGRGGAVASEALGSIADLVTFIRVEVNVGEILTLVHHCAASRTG